MYYGILLFNEVQQCLEEASRSLLLARGMPRLEG